MFYPSVHLRHILTIFTPGISKKLAAPVDCYRIQLLVRV
jgi:hypothetical protein